MAYLDMRDLAEELDDLEARDEDELDDEDKERLADLRNLQDQLFTGSLHEYGQNEPTMIPDYEFKEYAEEFAYDVGYASSEDNNPLHGFIDWEAWADWIKGDYTEVEFDRTTYLIRAY